MASITPFRTLEVFPNVTIGDTIANVDFAVRPSQTNNTGDVQLVQVLLASALGVSEQIGVPMRDESGTAIQNTGMSVTGIYDRETQRILRAFQRHIRDLTKSKPLVRAKASIHVDGVVDKSNPTGVSTISKTIYTIVYLNVAFISFNGHPFTAEDAEGHEPLQSQIGAIDLDRL